MLIPISLLYTVETVETRATKISEVNRFHLLSQSYFVLNDWAKPGVYKNSLIMRGCTWTYFAEKHSMICPLSNLHSASEQAAQTFFNVYLHSVHNFGLLCLNF